MLDAKRELLPQSEVQLSEWEVIRPVCFAGALPIVPLKRLDQGLEKHRPALRRAQLAGCVFA